MVKRDGGLGWRGRRAGRPPAPPFRHKPHIHSLFFFPPPAHLLQEHKAKKAHGDGEAVAKVHKKKHADGEAVAKVSERACGLDRVRE